MKTKLLLLLLLITPDIAISDDLKHFESDGCSSFPDGTLKQKKLWLTCCIEHDKRYWLGGTYEERVKADDDLKICVAKVGGPALAQIMLTGVRVGGAPYLPTTFRWGYGWTYPRGYKTLTEKERKDARNKISDVPPEEKN